MLCAVIFTCPSLREHDSAAQHEQTQGSCASTLLGGTVDPLPSGGLPNERRPRETKTVHCGLQQTTARISGRRIAPTSCRNIYLAAQPDLPTEGRATRAAPVTNSASARDSARAQPHLREAKPRSESQRLSYTGPREMAQSLRLPGPDKWSRPTREDNSPVYSTKPA